MQHHVSYLSVNRQFVVAVAGLGLVANTWQQTDSHLKIEVDTIVEAGLDTPMLSADSTRTCAS